MDKKNSNRTHIICNIITALLILISLAIISCNKKMDVAIRQEISREIDRREELTAEFERQIDRYEEIYGEYTDALERNTEACERMILFFKQLSQKEGRGIQ